LKFLKYWPSSHDFNKLVIKAKIHANTYFWNFLCCMKIQYDFIFYFFVFEIFGRMHENKTFYFMFFVWMKIRYLKSDLYLYSIKIQTNIDQNAVKYLRKITDFKKNFSKKFFIFGLGQPGPCGWAGPSHPCTDTGPSQSPKQTMHAWNFTRAWKSAKVIILPSHCSCSFLQIAKTSPCLKCRRILVVSCVFSLFLFFRLTWVNSCTDRERK